MKKQLAVLLLAPLFALPTYDAKAAGKVCSEMELKRSGELRGTGRSVGFIIGVRWGVGMVRMDDGRTFQFRAKGVKPVEMGAAETKFVGIVYNLDKPEDFAGVYGGIATGLTAVTKGFGGAAYQNGKCVTMQIKRFDPKGVQGSLPMMAGIHVELTK